MFSIGPVPQRAPLSTMTLQPWELGSWAGLPWRANILCSASWMAWEKELSWPSLLPVGFSKTFQMYLSSENILMAGNNASWGLEVWNQQNLSKRSVLKYSRVSGPCPSLVESMAGSHPLMGSHCRREVGILWMHWWHGAKEQFQRPEFSPGGKGWLSG